MPDTTPNPDDKRIFELLCQLGLDPDKAYTFVQELQNMAAANLIARFESKLDAQNAKIDSLRGAPGLSQRPCREIWHRQVASVCRAI